MFGPSKGTEQIYEQVGSQLVSSVLKGMNGIQGCLLYTSESLSIFHGSGTIFAYGQTASGKTFTMQGDRKQSGILSLAVEQIFDEIEAMPHFQFMLHVSYIEIFNEVRILLRVSAIGYFL